MTKKLIVLIFTLAAIVSYSTAQTNNKVPDNRGFVLKLGDMSPDFTMKFPDKKPSVKLSELRGKVVMLQFTASWCGVCIKEMPHIEKDIWKAFKDKGLHVYGVDRKESKKQVLKFAKKTKVTYPLVMDEDGKIFELFAHENAGVTRNILIDKEGKIVFMTRLFVQSEFKELVQKIDALLK